MNDASAAPTATPSVDASGHPRPPVNWHAHHKASLSFGDVSADKLRNGMGSWGFVFAFVGLMILWASVNLFLTARGGSGWDPYPFILLNLFLSMLAGLQGAILLIAAKRQDSIASALAEHDYQTNRAAKREIEVLTDINRRQLEMLTTLHARLMGTTNAAPKG